MPLTGLKEPKFTPPKDVVISWDTWRKGLNLLLRENELNGSEMAASTNLLLVGSGVPTKRWGSQNYYQAGPTTTIATRFVMPIKDANDNQQVLALTDWGIMTKKSGATYAPIAGASWPSGSLVEATQLGGNVYMVSPLREFVRYDFSTLTAFATIGIPTGTTATNMSSATGSSQWSWRVSAIGKSGGETIASQPFSSATLPQDLTKTVMRVSWNAVSAASGDLIGYNVYRGSPGDERWVGGVDDTTLKFDDVGLAVPDPFRVVPVADTSGGPKAKYIIRYQDRLIIAGIPGQPTKVMISGRYPFQERFDWYAGGGYIYIEPDSGQNITGLGIHQEKLVVFKENSVWQVLLPQIQFGQYLVLDPQYKLLTASQGCSSHRSICPVENDLMFANRKGIYILRYEPQLLTILNANEISAKIRPFFEGMTESDHTSTAAAYIDKKYLLSFPNAKQTIAFDRERLSFIGPWDTPFGIYQWAKYVDSNGTERWIAADYNDAYITEFADTFPDDKGTAIRTVFKSKKEDFGDWTLFKTVNEVYMNFRSIRGSIDINIYLEERSGNTVIAKSFTITATGSSGTSGFGTDMFGTTKFGLTNNIAQFSSLELPRKAFIYKSSRIFQLEVRTTGKTDNYELLGVKTIAIPQARGNSPSAWNV
jgi:hypothetical protein